MTKRFHKDIFWPQDDKLKIGRLVHNLNHLSFTPSKHCFDRLIEKSNELQKAGLAIKNHVLSENEVFEYYKEENNHIFKMVFRIPFDSQKDLILVLDDNKSIVTVYFNSKEDNHKTLDKEAYQLEAV